MWCFILQPNISNAERHLVKAAKWIFTDTDADPSSVHETLNLDGDPIKLAHPEVELRFALSVYSPVARMGPVNKKAPLFFSLFSESIYPKT